MFADFEEKGKIFTQVVTKEPIEVIMQTTNGTIHGKVHVRLDERLKDELDNTSGFIAVTDAEIHFPDPNKAVIHTHFMAVNITHIVWVTPKEELSTENNGES